MVDALLTAKRETAEKQCVVCKWHIELPPKLPLSMMELVAFLGNAIDNAIEACQAVDAEKYIAVTLRVENNVLLCEITNPFSKQPITANDTLITTKPNAQQHGVGLRSMQADCMKMNGQMSYSYDDGVFELRMLAPLPESVG